MTDSNHVQPQQRTTLLAAVGWRLFPDPSLVAQLCHRLPAKVADHWLFPDPGKVVRPLPAEVTNQIIDREASLLKRRKVLLTIARRARDIAMTDPSALRPEVREHLLRRAQRRVPEDQNLLHVHVYRSPHKPQQQRQEEEIAMARARAIGAAICDVWEEVRNGKWRAFGRDPETKKRVQIDRAEFSGAPPTLRRVLEDRVGGYEDVTFERVEEPAEEAAVAGEDEAVVRSGAPGRPTSMHLVEGELDRRVAAGVAWPSKISGASDLSNWLIETHPNAPRLTPKTIKNKLGRKIPTA